MVNFATFSISKAELRSFSLVSLRIVLSRCNSRTCNREIDFFREIQNFAISPFSRNFARLATAHKKKNNCQHTCKTFFVDKIQAINPCKYRQCGYKAD